MTKKFLLIFLLVLFNIHAMSKRNPSYEKVMDVIHKYSKSLKKEKGIVLTCYGLHYAGPDKVYDGKIHVIDLGYKVLDKRMQYKEARSLFYSVVDGLLLKINESESLSDYFFHYPVSYEDLKFHLSFDYDDKGHLKKDDIWQICILENQIMYFLMNKDAEPNKPALKRYASNGFSMIDFDDQTRTIRRKLPEKEE